MSYLIQFNYLLYKNKETQKNNDSINHEITSNKISLY